MTRRAPHRDAISSASPATDVEDEPAIALYTKLGVREDVLHSIFQSREVAALHSNRRRSGRRPGAAVEDVTKAQADNRIMDLQETA